MFACEYKFFPRKGISSEGFLQDFWSFVGALVRGGQTMNEDSIIQSGSLIRYVCICPEKDSLNVRNHSTYAQKSYKKLLKASARKPQIKMLGKIVEGPLACKCRVRPFLVLFTNFLDHSSPIICGKCRQPVPLYHLPRLESGNYRDYLAWQENYRSCDSLFMLSGVGEKFGYDQISELKSELTKFGRTIGASLEKKAGVPVYYYLHRYYGTSPKAESKKRCPGCGSRWAEQESKTFQMRCDKCKLLSTPAQDFLKS